MGKAKAAKVEKKVQKIVEDKTFGLKNKNKSAKVQKYVEQVNQAVRSGGGKQSAAYHAQNAATKKAEKDARKQAELEMFKLLGDAYQLKNKSKSKKKKEAEAAEKEKENLKDVDQDVEVTPLKDILMVESKKEVARILVVLEHKDNLIAKDFQGRECITIMLSDGTTGRPMKMLLAGFNPTTFDKKVNQVLDIRNVVVMLRGDKVVIESTTPTTTEVAKVKEANNNEENIVKETKVYDVSDEVRDEVLRQKKESEDLRAKGDMAVEQRIEEQRFELLNRKDIELIPVTKERFFEWKEMKKRKMEKEAEDKRQTEEKKAGKSVKNMNVLTGKQLFLVDKSLFVDDQDAFLQNVDDIDDLSDVDLDLENLDLNGSDDGDEAKTEQ